MDYKYEEFKWLAKQDGFYYPIDVKYGSIFLGTLEAKPDGVSIRLIDTPIAKWNIPDSPKLTFKTQELAAKNLHKLWRIFRSGLHPVSENSKKQLPDSVLNIPEYEKEGDKYPGNLKPGYYNRKELAQMLIQHKNDKSALQFIADMLETGNPEEDAFVFSLRRVLNSPVARERFLSGLQEFV